MSLQLRIAIFFSLILAGCTRFPSSSLAPTAIEILSLRLSSPRYAYITSTSTNDILSYSVDGLGNMTQIGSINQPTLPAIAVPDTSGKFLHFQTSAASTLHWRALTKGVPASSGGFLATTSNAILQRSVIYPNFMIGLVSGGGSSLQTYPLASDGSVTAPTAGMDVGTNYSSMAQHPTLPLIYIIANSGASLQTASVSASGVIAFKSSMTVTAAAFVAVDPLGRYLLLANANSVDNVSYYSLDAAGNPTFVQSITAGAAFSPAIAIEPLGRYAYILRQTSGSNLTTIQIIPTFQTLGTIASGNTPSFNTASLLVDNGGRFLYAAGNTPPGVTLFYIPLLGGIPRSGPFYSAAGTATIGLYQTSRCLVAIDLDC